jgi:hypothetical protein
MRPQDLKEELRRQPFDPVRLHLTDGTVYEIRHPDLVMVGRSKLLVGTPAEGVPGVFERYDVVSLLHVVRLEPIEPPTASASS